jgi:hypothetical protein
MPLEECRVCSRAAISVIEFPNEEEIKKREQRILVDDTGQLLFFVLGLKNIGTVFHYRG